MADVLSDILSGAFGATPVAVPNFQINPFLARTLSAQQPRPVAAPRPVVAPKPAAAPAPAPAPAAAPDDSDPDSSDARNKAQPKRFIPPHYDPDILRQQLAPALAQTDKELGLPPGTAAAQIDHESSFKNLHGKLDEEGIAQMRPSTTALLEKRLGRKFDPWNPQDAVILQREYLRMLIEQHGGDIHSAIAGYNGTGVHAQNYADSILGRNPGTSDDQDGGGGGPAAGDVSGEVGETRGILGAAGADQVAQAQQASIEQQKRMAEAAGQFGQQLDDISARNREAIAGIPAPPKAPAFQPAPQAQQTDPTRVYGQIMPVLIMLGGLAVKHNGVAALNAATAAMGAAKTNDEEAFQKAHQKWLDDQNTAMQAYSAQRDEWDDLFKHADLTTREGQLEAETIARKWDNQVVLAQLAQGNVSAAIQSVNMFTSAFEHIDAIHARAAAQANLETYRKEEIDEKRADREARAEHWAAAGGQKNLAVYKLWSDFQKGGDVVYGGVTYTHDKLQEIFENETPMGMDKSIQSDLHKGQVAYAQAQDQARSETPPAPDASGGQYAQAPLDPAQRTANTVYMTPKGPLLWDGSAWHSPAA